MPAPTLDELKALVQYYAGKAARDGLAMPAGGPTDSETVQEYRQRILNWLVTVEPDTSKRAAALLSIRIKF